MSAARRSGVWRALPGALPCALAAHAAVYRSFWPSDGVHGYFGWYQPAVGAASLASVIALVVFLVVARTSRMLDRPLLLRPRDGMLPRRRRIRSTATAAVVLLIVQETLERSIPAGHVVPAAFLPSQWLTLLAAAALASLVLACALRLAEGAIRAVLRTKTHVATETESGTWSVVVARPARPRPLALRFALRAPPLLPA